MTLPGPFAAAPSALRTGFKAGAAFAGSVVKGGLLAVFLGGGAFLFHVLRLNGAGSHAGHAGGFGAVLALVSSPPLLVALLLLLVVPIYVVLGMAHGRSRALQVIVEGHGDDVAARISSVLAERIEAVPRLSSALRAAPERLSLEALSRQLAPLVGESRVVRAALGALLKRLPLPQLLASTAADESVAAGSAGAGGQPLRQRLRLQILRAMEQAAAPSWRLLYWVLGAHALLLAIGVWITR